MSSKAKTLLLGDSNEIVVYQPDGTVRLDVILENETVWLTQAQMTELFQTTKQNISLHISNIFREGELVEDVVVKESLTTTKHGAFAEKTQTNKVKLYNLDVIISVGYRVKSHRGTQFRIWATDLLREFLLRGYSVNQRIERLERRIDNVEGKVERGRLKSPVHFDKCFLVLACQGHLNKFIYCDKAIASG